MSRRSWLVYDHPIPDRKEDHGVVVHEAQRRTEAVLWLKEHAYGEIVVWRQQLAPGHYRYAVANHRTLDIPAAAIIIRRDLLAALDNSALSDWDRKSGAHD